jgi:uncharacterized protein (TIGR00251 family)
MAGAWHWENGDLLLNIHVQPRASRDEIAGLHGDALKIRVTSPPVDGRANDHLLRFLAATFGVARGNVELLAGETGRRKRFRVRAPTRLPAGVERP